MHKAYALIPIGLVVLLTGVIFSLSSNNTQAAGSSAFGGGNIGGVDCNSFNTVGDASGGARITAGGKTIVAGYTQTTGINQNATVVAFDAATGNKVWCIQPDTAPPDGRARGLWWDGTTLYVAFTVDGGDGSFNVNFATGGGWLTNLAGAGSGAFTVLARVDPNTGTILNGTYITSILSSGNPNSFTPQDMLFTGSSIIITGQSSANPRETDRSRMTCNYTGAAQYTIEFNPTLSGALGVLAANCTPTSPPPSVALGFGGGGGDTGGGGGTGGGAFIPDGRLNGEALAGPVAIYCGFDGGVVVYGIDPGNASGYLLFSATRDEVQAGISSATTSGQYATIKSAGPATLYALTTGELQVNSFKPDGNLYEYIFSGNRCG